MARDSGEAARINSNIPMDARNGLSCRLSSIEVRSFGRHSEDKPAQRNSRCWNTRYRPAIGVVRVAAVTEP